jgi:hypothetical protein
MEKECVKRKNRPTKPSAKPTRSYPLVAEDAWNQTVYAYFQVFSG